jgi:hypothetical protein
MVSMPKINLTTLNNVAETIMNANLHTGALIIKKWSVFKCMVITTRNYKKMDKLLQINYALRNWLIMSRHKNMIRSMMICSAMKTPFGPNLPIAIALKSHNVTNKTQSR